MCFIIIPAAGKRSSVLFLLFVQLLLSQLLAGGRHLHIPAARVEDEGTFECLARNEAGEAKKTYKMVVLGEVFFHFFLPIMFPGK